jgi:NADH-quinone oxidoreductase subunit L
MTRCIWLTFFGEPRGHAADPHHPPHESGPRIVVPLYILAGLAVVAGFANFPFGGESIKLRFEHYVEPVAGYFPEIPHPEFTGWIAVVSTLAALLAIGVAYAYWFQGRFHGATERSRVARAGQTLLVNKYYFDHLYSDVIAGGVKGPVARAAYWFNQNVLDGVVNGVAAVANRTAQLTYDYIDQGLVDGTVNGSGYASESFGQALRRLQTGRVQQYGALLFGGAVILAGILVVTI